ncbi:MAG: tetratricopeptide repeat protein [Candidatus Krumholzibacteria bacterium]|nr:tetratricopeptide repeat protein [Candidatus Krumholzibacteria bacterium]
MSANRIAVAAALAALAVMANATLAEVQWAEDPWESILERAKSERKHVYVDFYATWCGPCKQMEKVTYPDEAVSRFLGGMIPVKYDAETGAGEVLAEKYRVVAYPTLIIFDPGGEEIDRHVGYLEPEPFVEKFQGYIDGIGTVSYYKEKLAENPDDIETLYTLGMKHVDAVRAEEAQACLARVMELDPDDAQGRFAGITYALGEVMYTTDRYADAKRYFEALIARYPDSEAYESGLRRLAATEYKLQNADAAVAAYRKVVERHPDDPLVLNGFAWFCAQRGIGLDEALAVALKAADLSGRDAGILDTLAEVYYARGEYDQAIEVGKEALEKDPEDTYFKNQVEKFRKAKADADAQARR